MRSRALRNGRIRGVKTNMAFLDNILKHPTLGSKVTCEFLLRMNPNCLSLWNLGNRAINWSIVGGKTIVNGNSRCKKIWIGTHISFPSQKSLSVLISPRFIPKEPRGPFLPN